MADTLTPDDGQRISKADAKNWITDYKNKNPDQVWAQFYGSNKLAEMLNQNECIGIRIYVTTNATGKNQLVLVGARKDGNNIWPKIDSTDPNADGMILDFGAPCPPICNID